MIKNRGENPIFIFDLDGTTVDSRHRTSMPFNLDYWNENSTRENILKDRLLPLSRKMVELIAFGYEVIICTARTLGKYDYAKSGRNCWNCNPFDSAIFICVQFLNFTVGWHFAIVGDEAANLITASGTIDG